MLPCAAVLVFSICASFAGLLFMHSKEDEPVDGDLVSEVLTDLPSWSWWTARVLLTNQRLLNRSAATLRSALSMLMPQVGNWFNLQHSLDACQVVGEYAHIICRVWWWWQWGSMRLR